MNPLVTALIGNAARWLIATAAAKGIDMTEDQSMQVVLGLAALVSLGWGQVRVWINRRKLTTALAMDAPMSERALEFEIQAGNAASVLTQKSEVPR